MDYVSAATIIGFYEQVDVFLAVFVRILAFCIVMPVFSGQNIPMMLKIMIALAISSIVMASGTIAGISYTNSVFGYISLILAEFLNGFIIGFIVYFMFTLFYFIGQMVDYQLGFSMVSVFDPVSQLQVPITGNLFYLMIMMVLVISGGFNYFIKLLIESFSIIPLGYANSVTNERLVSYLIDIMVRYFELGVLISLPVVGTIVIIDIALGFLVKAVPQMNVFVVGIPIKIFVGLIVVAFILPSLIDAFRIIFELTVEYVMEVTRGLAL